MNTLWEYDLSPETLSKTAQLRDCFVFTPRMNEVVQATRMLHQVVPAMRNSTRPGGHADCKLVVGLPGSGKTTAMRYYADSLPPVEEQERTYHRVLYVQVPPEATLKAFAQTLLAAMHRGTHRGAQAEQTSRFLGLARATGLELLIVDEAQNLGRMDDRRNPNATANWVRGLLDAKLFNILLVGLPEAATIFTSKLDLVRRGGGVIHLRPYDWDDQNDRQVFRMFLHKFDQQMGLSKPAALADERMALRLYNFSGGLVGLVVRLLESANEIAWATGMDKVTLDLLARVADGYRPAGLHDWSNPFRVRSLEPTRPGVASVSLNLGYGQESPIRLRRASNKGRRAA